MSTPRLQELSVASQERQIPRQLVSSLWKFSAAFSSQALLVGFLVLPLAFGDDEAESHANKTPTTIAAFILIAIAYSLSLAVVCFQSQDHHFLLYSLFLPCLGSNLLALLNVLLNVIYRNLLPLGDLEIVSLGLPSAFAFLSGLGALWAYAWDIPGLSRAGDRHRPHLTDEEMQRQQLQRLLEPEYSQKKRSSKVYPKTFQVNTPELVNPGKGWNTFIPPPREENYFR
ncbi:hypothetical protein BO86DRAFT_421098 [Aspergillus japonicus CBS 114.51]|uniref:Uncharacterized protein n=2 Tax=Aspergillus TaxID=5052 RepID=A0A2V5IV64_ASPV1|nr:hypothetical protein BO86DRAFT_421098 [Aspergillus japonicus CBS 114.51]PYI23896.1 hypothetical protein BO99DRAFT_428696 [Aspergillus violaceofuscus CBS 115571]RAH79012.1 hypothetical protein BO86DRAFT_421098 [Aspergillus japonicus CBS 114.51]